MTKIHHLTNSEIDKNRWDSLIENAPNGCIYAMSWYLDIVSEGWEALITDGYENVFPLTCKERFGVKYLCQPPFSQQLGLFSKQKESDDLINDFFEQIPSRYKLVEINLNKANRLAPAKSIMFENRNYELDLSQAYEALRASYSNNLKRNINKAKKAGLKLLPDVPVDDVITMFKGHKGRQIKTMDNTSYDMLRALTAAALERDSVEIWGAYEGATKELCGAAVFLKWHQQTVFLFSALNNRGKQSAAMPLIIDNFIHENAAKKTTLDFEGSNDVNLARFYKSFGAKKNTYLSIKMNNLSYFVKLLFFLYKKLK